MFVVLPFRVSPSFLFLCDYSLCYQKPPNKPTSQSKLPPLPSSISTTRSTSIAPAFELHTKMQAQEDEQRGTAQTMTFRFFFSTSLCHLENTAVCVSQQMSTYIAKIGICKATKRHTLQRSQTIRVHPHLTRCDLLRD